MKLLLLCVVLGSAWSLHQGVSRLVIDYYLYKNVHYVCYLSCGVTHYSKTLALEMIAHGIRVSAKNIESEQVGLERLLDQWNVDVGVLLDDSCDRAQTILDQASSSRLLDSSHAWLVVRHSAVDAAVGHNLGHLNLSVDADVVVASYYDGRYLLTDIFNFGNIQGNPLEQRALGVWRHDTGLEIYLKGFKYYHRWNFHNLTLRAITVMREKPELFRPDMLSEMQFTPGVAVMTKITSQLLNLLKEQHNFRFNYTLAGRWIGEPGRNSTLAVTNSLYWGEQDLSSTAARIFPHWLEWVDVYFPPTTNLQTKFYYLIADKGVGAYENRFLSPMSPGVWWSAALATAVCAAVLAAAAAVEAKAQPGQYAFFSVLAAICQQEFEDGMPSLAEAISSQGRRCTLLVVGVTSMLLYNYYTSSVVSWLLNAAAPSIADMDQLIGTNLELIFEDIGYTRGWLENPGFFYYSGFKNPKEDELREKKVTKAKRTLPPLQPAHFGLELVRTGGYAYHTEPYTASEVISRTFREEELCKLGALQMMRPAHVYIMSQRRSPYKQFFVWSLMRLSERGHVRASQGRFAGAIPRCSGRKPRALALGQAAPAFLLLLEAALVSTAILVLEMACYRYHNTHRVNRQQEPPRELGR